MRDPDDSNIDEIHLQRLQEARRQTSPTTTPAPRLAPPAPYEGPSRKGLLGGLAALGLILWKAKALIVLGLGKLKFILAGLKFLSLGKVLTTGGTMILTIWVYAQTYGFAYAAGFVLLIFLHEMGHAAAIRLHGLEAGAPVFIPFVGALIAMKKMPPNVRVEAEVAIAGPIAGGLAAAACWALGVALASPLLHALAFSGFLLNLFNLLPVSPLDGGRIVGAISRWLWLAGLAVALAMAIVTGHFLLWLVVILGAVRAVSTFRGTANEPPGYFEIRPFERGLIAVGYFGLAALLAVGTVALSPRG